MSSSCGGSCVGSCAALCSGCAGSDSTSCYVELSGACLTDECEDIKSNIDISQKSIVINMICDSCGGSMQLKMEEGHHILYCPYCHTKRAIIQGGDE